MNGANPFDMINYLAGRWRFQFSRVYKGTESWTVAYEAVYIYISLGLSFP